MSYDGEAGPDEVCRHNIYYRSCSTCWNEGRATRDAGPVVTAERGEFVEGEPQQFPSPSMVSAPQGIASMNPHQWLQAGSHTEVYFARLTGFNVYFFDEKQAMDFGRTHEVPVYEVPVYRLASEAAQDVAVYAPPYFHDRHVAGMRDDPVTGKRGWGYMDLRDSKSADPEWETYKRLKEKFDVQSG